MATNLREQAEAGRSGAQRLSEQADRQQEAGRALAQESLGAYMDFLTWNGIPLLDAGQTAAGVVGTVTDATSRTVDAATGSVRRTTETATFPIPGYDEMNVDEISARVDGLTDDQVRRLRDYEKANENRKTLIDRFDSKLRA